MPQYPITLFESNFCVLSFKWSIPDYVVYSYCKLEYTNLFLLFSFILVTLYVLLPSIRGTLRLVCFLTFRDVLISTHVTLPQNMHPWRFPLCLWHFKHGTQAKCWIFKFHAFLTGSDTPTICPWTQERFAYLVSVCFWLIIFRVLVEFLLVYLLQVLNMINCKSFFYNVVLYFIFILWVQKLLVSEQQKLVWLYITRGKGILFRGFSTVVKISTKKISSPKQYGGLGIYSISKRSKYKPFGKTCLESCPERWQA